MLTLTLCISQNCLLWFGHVYRNTGWILLLMEFLGWLCLNKHLYQTIITELKNSVAILKYFFKALSVYWYHITSNTYLLVVYTGINKSYPIYRISPVILICSLSSIYWFLPGTSHIVQNTLHCIIKKTKTFIKTFCSALYRLQLTKLVTKLGSFQLFPSIDREIFSTKRSLYKPKDAKVQVTQKWKYN